MNKNYAVILSGCGAMDGSEIHEAVSALLAIAKAGNKYTIFAPNIEQKHVVNHNEAIEMQETRNVLVEAGRIARGNIFDLETINVADFDGLVIPGGFGAAKNLFDFAFKHTDFTILPIFEKVVREFNAMQKPIGAMCVSPVVIAKIFGDKAVELTLGGDSPLNKEIEEKFGAKVIITSRSGVVIDSINKVVTTPCYMYGDSSIVDIAMGAENMVAELDKL